jgi:hypothetical protein
MSVFIKQHTNVVNNFSKENGWVILSEIEARIKAKIEAVGVPLKDWDINIYRGILTGYNEAFIIDQKTKDELIAKSDSTDLSDIIRPILRGKHIKKYNVNNSESLILIPCGWTNLNRGNNAPEIFFKEKYPKVYDHLIEKSKIVTKGKGLFNRDDKGDYWWELRPCSYLKEFEKDKIIYIDIMTDNEEDGYLFPCFSFSNKAELILNTAYFMSGKTEDLKYLLAILNSKVGKFIVRNFVTQLGERQFRLFQQNVETFPLAKASTQQMANLISYTNVLIDPNQYQLVKNKYEYQINKLVSELYDLTIEERGVIGLVEVA